MCSRLERVLERICWKSQPSNRPILAQLSLVLGPCVTSQRVCMGDYNQEGPSDSGRWHNCSSSPGVKETVGVATEGAELIAAGL